MTVLRRHLNQLYLASQWILLAGAIAVAVISSHAGDWQPLQLVVLLLVLTIASDRLTVTMGSQTVTASFIALVLAMTLLGPAPAALFGAVAIAVDSYSRRPPFTVCLSNMATYVAYSVSGGLLTRALLGDVHDPRNLHAIRSVTFALLVLGVYVVCNLINFALIAIQKRVLVDKRLMSQVRTVLIPVLPGLLAAAVLAAILAVAYTNLGYPVLVGVVAVILIFQYLAIALLRSEDRADQLEARSVRLASMQ
ncbi:MAG TPA: hypothetical protein VHS55_07685, partial [Solirubrobacteraceae bacterium]|nr:hypothetical protein [Solirubrobacteraceae bacterium]